MGIGFSFGWDTSLETAKANTLASSKAMVAHLNSELVKRYNSQFDSWKVMVEAGKIDNQTPPQPPTGWELQMDSANVFTFYGIGSKPVCEPRQDIPPDYSKPNTPLLPEPDHIRSVPPGDNSPVGFIAIGPDGSKWQKQSSVTPFGVAYFYVRIA